MGGDKKPTIIRKALVKFSKISKHYTFSSLTRRIVFLNLAALLVLLSGILYLNQFRAGLIEAREESLLIQGQIIAGAIASSASIETDGISVDPERLIELNAGDSIDPFSEGSTPLDFPIDPERIAPVLRYLISPTRTRARIYDREGLIIFDSRHLYSSGQVLRFDLPPTHEPDKYNIFERFGKAINNWMQGRNLEVYKDLPPDQGLQYPEVRQALGGGPDSIVRITEHGTLIVSVAVPVQRFRAVLGVLQLSTQGDDIDKIVAAERLAILKIFGVAAVVTLVLSFLLAGTIAVPLRRLAEAAIRVRTSVKAREEIPDYSERQDEIGNLSKALRSMTSSLYARIDAIERFAADVSHELKNPLTSLRSAVETLPAVRNEDQQKRLLDVIQHDVQRLDRLISDISDASRLDAELVREDMQPLDLTKLCKSILDYTQQLCPDREILALNLDYEDGTYIVLGHESRLGQVLNNLLDNAKSFIPDRGGQIDIHLTQDNHHVTWIIEDNGPGIKNEQFDRIFKRFYTDRPEGEAFGQNSGLGLSITQQIIEAHGGKIEVQNKSGDEGAGARFIIRLPRALMKVKVKRND
jgi:two-component system sensor histidine kinase ChvG